jgi:hypothetical protein
LHWKQFILITRELPVWIVTAAVLISIAGSAELVVYLVYATISQLKGSRGRPLDLIIAASLGIVAILIIFTFPVTIVVTDNGLEQIPWLWKKKQIRWADIVEINTGEKRRTVTITGADGTKIVHSRQLPDRSRC